MRRLRVFLSTVFYVTPTSCVRCRRASSWQRQTLAKIRNWNLPVYVVPESREADCR